MALPAQRARGLVAKGRARLTAMEPWWLAINFLWSAVLVFASVQLFSTARQVEGEREKYRRYLRSIEEQERKQRRL